MTSRQSDTIVWHTNSLRISHFDVPSRPGVQFYVSCSYALASESPALRSPGAVRLVIWSEGMSFSTVPSDVEAAAKEAAKELLKTARTSLEQRLPGREVATLPSVMMRWLCTPIITPWQVVSGTASDGEFFARGRICSRQLRNLPLELMLVISMPRLTRGTMGNSQVMGLVQKLQESQREIAAQLRLQGTSVTVHSQPRYVVDDSREVVSAPEGPSSFAHVRSVPLRRTQEENQASQAAAAMARRAKSLATHAGDLVRR